MSQSHIFTKRSMGLDTKVWFVMLVVIVLCIGLMSYKLISKNSNKPCIPVTLMVNGLENQNKALYNINEPLLFKASTAPGSDVTWDFGDNSKKEEGFTTSHIYKTPGTFPITITVNGKCDNFLKINIIKPAPVIRDSVGNITENIIGPDQTTIGQPVQFTTPLTADAYEWSIVGNDHFPVRPTKDASFKFSLPGTYTLQLMLNKDRIKRYSKNITVISDAAKVDDAADKPKPTVLIKEYVIPKKPDVVPVEPAPAQPAVVAPPPVVVEKPKPVYKMVSNKLLQGYLEEVIQGKRTVQDFDMFLCSGANTRLNGNGKLITFGAFCEMIKGNKKYKIKSVEQGKENDCIVTLSVEYKKSWF